MPNVIEIQVKADDKASKDMTASGKKLVTTAGKAGDDAGEQFSKEFAQSLKSGTGDWEKTAKTGGQDAGHGYGQSYVDGANGVLRGGFGVVKQQLEGVADDAGNAGRKAGKNLADGVESGAKGANLSGSFKGELSQIEDQAGTSGRSAGKALGDGVEDGVKSGKAGIRAGFSGLGDDLKDSLIDAGQNGGEGLLEGLTSAVGSKAGIVGAGLGGMLVKGIMEGASRSDLSKLFGASNGLSGDDAKKAGSVAGKLYSQGLGESVEANLDIASDVVTQLQTPVNSVDFEPIMKKAVLLQKVFGVDTTEALRAVGQMVKTGMVPDVQSGMDLLAKGLQNGNDQAGDLLDTLNEYPTQFRKLGLSGADAMLLIQQGLQGGARDSDIVADSLKELSIRAVDGSKTTEDAYKSLGLNAKKTAEAFGHGGEQARTALDSILDKLRAIKDPVEQNRIGVELFGTQWEDMGKAINAMDLTPAENQFANFNGTLDQVGNTVSQTFDQKVRTALNQARDVFSDFTVSAGDDMSATTSSFLGNVGLWTVGATEATTNWLGNAGKWVNSFIGVRDTSQNAMNVVTGNLQGGGLAASLFANQLVQATDSGQAGFRGLQGAGGAAKSVLDRLPGDYRSNIIAYDHASAIAAAVQTKLQQIHDKYVSINVGVKGPGAGFWSGMAHGGVEGAGHAAEGGPRSNMTLVGEQGPELVNLAPGSFVRPAGQTRSMVQDAAATRGGPVVLELRSSGSAVDDFLVEMVSKAVRDRGGNVQAVLGR